MMNTIKNLLLSVLLISVLSAFTQETQKKKNKSLETATIKTTAECEQCKDRLEETIAYEKGVKYVNLDLETKELTVKYRSDKNDIHKLRKAVSEIGYDADKVKADPKAYAKLPECCKIGGHSKNKHIHEGHQDKESE